MGVGNKAILGVILLILFFQTPATTTCPFINIGKSQSRKVDSCWFSYWLFKILL